MTIQRARELLGEDIAQLSDEDAARLNNETAAMCSNYLKFLISHPVAKPVIDTKEKLM